MYSPLFIEIALYYHYSPHPWPDEEMHPAHTDIHNELFCLGMIERDANGRWRGVAEPLRLYAEALGNVPAPVHIWVVPTPEET